MTSVKLFTMIGIFEFQKFVAIIFHIQKIPLPCNSTLISTTAKNGLFLLTQVVFAFFNAKIWF